MLWRLYFANHISNKKLLFVLALISLSASALLTLWIGYPRGIGTDGAFYALSGYNFFHGNGYTYSDVPNTFTWPLFALLIGLLNFLISDLQLCAHMILILSFAAGVFPFYYLVRNLFGDPVARIAAVLYFLNGFLLRMSARISPELLLIFLLIVSLYFASKIIRDLENDRNARTVDFLRTGLFLGLSYLTKPEAFQYFVVIFFFLIIFVIGKHVMSGHWISLACMAAVFIALVFPQINFIHRVTGKWELTTYNRFIFRGFVEPFVSLNIGEAAKDPHTEYNYNAFIVRGPYTREQMELDLGGLYRHTGIYMKSLLTIVGPLHLLLFVFSFFHRSSNFKWPLMLVRLLLVPMMTLFLWYYPIDIFFIVFIPFFLITAAWAIEQIRLLWSNKPYARWAFSGLIVLSFLQSYTPIVNQSPTNRVIANHQQMGEWIRDHVPDIEGKLIADRKPYISFLAKARYFRYNNVSDYPTLIATLKQYHADYLIVDDFFTFQKNSAVLELLDGKNRPELNCVHVLEDEDYGRTVLYKVN